MLFLPCHPIFPIFRSRLRMTSFLTNSASLATFSLNPNPGPPIEKLEEMASFDFDRLRAELLAAAATAPFRDAAAVGTLRIARAELELLLYTRLLCWMVTSPSSTNLGSPAVELAPSLLSMLARLSAAPADCALLYTKNDCLPLRPAEGSSEEDLPSFRGVLLKCVSEGLR